ncbi:MAG: DUF2335 domain-containing protein [Planctomycetia bacterium]|nr:DUF2335 domain-containing protein [Planctomycetia bacterium]
MAKSQRKRQPRFPQKFPEKEVLPVEIQKETDDRALEKAEQQLLHQRIISRSGPLPLASEYAYYERVCPGAADRILVMAEKQQNHVLENERKQVEADIKLAFREGWLRLFCTILGFLIIIACLVLSGVLAWMGKDKGCIAAACSPAGAFITIYLVALIRKKPLQESKEKSKKNS